MPNDELLEALLEEHRKSAAYRAMERGEQPVSETLRWLTYSQWRAAVERVDKLLLQYSENRSEE